MAAKYTTVAGGTIFVKVTGSAGDRIPGEKRAPKQKPTCEAVEKINQRNSEKQLAMILNHNFAPGDYHLTLTYGGQEPTEEEAMKQLKNFFAVLRRKYRRTGTVLKWVAVTELENKRIHHHVICSAGIELSEIQEAWSKNGLIRPTYLKRNRDYRRLAAYLIKETSKTFKDPETVRKQRYSCSRSVVRPETRKEEVSTSHLLSDPRPIPGYYIDPNSIYKGSNPQTGRPYIEYVMVCLNEIPRVKKWNRGQKAKERMSFDSWLRKNREKQLEIQIDIASVLL